MKYRVLKIVKISTGCYYDVDYKEITRFRPSTTFIGVRTKYDLSTGTGTIVSTGETLFNFGKIIHAYNYASVDFRKRSEPLPVVYTITSKGIY